MSTHTNAVATTSLKAEANFKFIVTREQWDRMNAYVQLSEIEISGFGLTKQERIKKGEISKNIVLEKLFQLPVQENTGASTEVEIDDMEDHFREEVPEYKDHKRIAFWWHSHVNMGVQWSTVDQRNIDSWSKSPELVSIVLNKRGEYSIRYDMFSPYRMTIHGIKLEIVGDTPMYADCRAEIAEKCKEKVFKAVTPGPNTVGHYNVYGKWEQEDYDAWDTWESRKAQGSQVVNHNTGHVVGKGDGKNQKSITVTQTSSCLNGKTSTATGSTINNKSAKKVSKVDPFPSASSLWKYFENIECNLGIPIAIFREMYSISAEQRPLITQLEVIFKGDTQTERKMSGKLTQFLAKRDIQKEAAQVQIDIFLYDVADEYIQRKMNGTDRETPNEFLFTRLEYVVLSFFYQEDLDLMLTNLYPQVKEYLAEQHDEAIMDCFTTTEGYRAHIFGELENYGMQGVDLDA